jgi:hypothetical protein
MADVASAGYDSAWLWCGATLPSASHPGSDGSARRNAGTLFTPPAGAGPPRRCTRAGSPWMPLGVPHKKRARLLRRRNEATGRGDPLSGIASQPRSGGFSSGVLFR